MIKPMLAVNADFSKIKFPVFIQEKFDGIRCIKLDGVLLSRSLKPIRNKHVQSLFEHLPDGVDGELVCGDIYAKDVFQKTTSAVMSVNGKPDVTLHLFDNCLMDSPYRERYESIWPLQGENVSVARNQVARSLKELEQIVEHYNENIKGEGLILRDPDSYYKHGRATVSKGQLLKVKPFVDAEFRVVGVTEMMHNDNEATINELGYQERSSKKSGKRGAGVMGTLVLESIDGSFEGEFECGTGFTLAQRKEMWQNKDELIGKLAKVRYQEAGMKDKPRIPSFKGWRDEEDM